MKYRNLGNTGLKVSEVGCGGIPFQRIDQDDVNMIFEVLIDNGVNFIDSARGYTVSEQLIGNAIYGIRNKFILATKSMSRTYDAMKNDISISLKNFQTDYIDLYQMHNLKPNEDYSGALQALKEAKAKGIIKHIGASFHNPDFAYQMITKEDNVLETIQVPYNFLENQSAKVIAKAKELGIGVLCMKPLAGGNIDKGKTSLKYILQNEGISVAIPGMDSVNQAIENTSITDYILTSEENEYINNLRSELKGSFCHRCGYCMPCTKGIDIVSTFTYINYYKRYHLEEWAQTRYNNMKVKASECIKCGKCETRCPYNINIIEKMSECAKLFEGVKNE